LEGLSDGRIVVNVLGHHLHNARKGSQRDECGIEALLLRRIGKRLSRQRLVVRQPTGEVQNLLRAGRRRRDLREQGVGIERYGRQQLVELLGRRRLYLSGCLRCQHYWPIEGNQKKGNKKPNGRLTGSWPHEALLRRFRNLARTTQILTTVSLMVLP
jgi:hypothetical protein